MAEESTDQLQQINDGLARYYKICGKPYDDEFIKYCNDNGLFDDAIADDFDDEIEPEDAMLPFFHTDDDENNLFPFQSQVADDQKTAKILEIIKICHEDENAFVNDLSTAALPKINAEFFVVKQKDLKESESILKSQMNVLYPKMKGDGGIKRLIAIGHKQRFPYIYFLGDAYSRDVAEGIVKSTDPGQWLMTKKTHTAKLKGFKPSDGKTVPIDIVTAGINGYFGRVCKRLVVDNMEHLIVDSLKEVSTLIAGSINLANTLAKTGPYLPLQFDACIAFGDVRTVETACSSSDDDDPATDDEKFEEVEDILGDVREKLKAHKLKYSEIEVTPDRKGRIYKMAFDKLQTEINSANKDSLFPKSRRFCSLMDRRKKKHEFLMWEAPKDCGIIPNDYKPGWFFNSSSATIIPHKGYKAGGKESSENVFIQNKKLSNLMVFSFHVTAGDEIRCYLYLGGAMTRFMPQDIYGMCQNLFDMKAFENQKFVDDKKTKETIDKLCIPDARFEKFRQYVSN